MRFKKLTGLSDVSFDPEESAYPYPDTESYPETEDHRIYRETYNTRPALRFIRSLADTRTAGDSAEE